MAKRTFKRRYGIVYLFDARVINWRQATSIHYGSTTLLENAIGQAARHVERSLLIEGEYAKAIVFDREEERILFIYSRTAEGVKRADFRKEWRAV